MFSLSVARCCSPCKPRAFRETHSALPDPEHFALVNEGESLSHIHGTVLPGAHIDEARLHV